MGVGCPCPPIRNDIVTPFHSLKLLFLDRYYGIGLRCFQILILILSRTHVTILPVTFVSPVIHQSDLAFSVFTSVFFITAHAQTLG